MIARWALAAALCALAGCGDAGDGDVEPASTSIAVRDASRAAPPVTSPTSAASECSGCHPGIVERYGAAHGMANSIGPIGDVVPGAVTNPHTGWRYEVVVAADGSATLESLAPDGGRRSQRVVGRVGAGVKDVSLVTTEVVDGAPTGHLFFAPVEFVVGHGWALAPFEDFGSGVATDFGLEAGCVQCHSGTGPATLPDTASATDAPDDPWARVFPRNRLGADAFEHLAPLGCDACHGDTSAHATAMRADPGGPLGIVPWDERPLSARRDACARCHMDGEARVDLLELNGELPPDGVESLSLRPVVVTAQPDDDFRFVAHHERLAMSRCFTESADMTCVSCHAPHTGVAAQGLEAFEQRCMTCHDGGARVALEAPSASSCSRGPELTVRDVTGAEARGATGCVDCHVRRTQPFDLGHVAVADHFVRRAIEPGTTLPPRAAHAPAEALTVFRHDGWDERLDTPDGQRWEQGVIGMALVKLGRFEEADEALSIFGVPERPDALTPTAPDGLQPLETSPAFHHVRGLVAERAGRAIDAERHHRNALRLEPGHPGARLSLARLLLARGDLAGTRDAITELLNRHPLTADAWTLMSQFGLKVGDAAGAAQALARSTQLWPSDPFTHRELARLLEALGDAEGARRAQARARELSPAVANSR